MTQSVQPSFVYDLISVAPPSAATLDLLNMPVQRKDTGEQIALGGFLTAVTASAMYTTSYIPSVVVVNWGQGVGPILFYQIIEALNHIGLYGGEWKAEGFGHSWDKGRLVNWVSAYAVSESTNSTYFEISPIPNFDKFRGIVDAWIQHIVQPVAKDDPPSFMIVATAKTQGLAMEIKDAAKKSLLSVCFPKE
jgi:hypothetical protein